MKLQNYCLFPFSYVCPESQQFDVSLIRRNLKERIGTLTDADLLDLIEFYDVGEIDE